MPLIFSENFILKITSLLNKAKYMIESVPYSSLTLFITWSFIDLILITVLYKALHDNCVQCLPVQNRDIEL